ncbi:hypothetical protein [Bradyrhizobium ottawaense]|uniref:Uncharacterized protein n=1 Tax=Bradyrhizobium ottawaense TaxID=931866 RepID=A0ABY0QHI7_9BRAD|nr:hypothetical protein [Bradyrhizobium ottawaense]SDK38443.1 hypothetical protein SAMN05444163_7985 [Bradyrhizobium ottawaense]SDK46472.1 hypothetical protein SAMN05444163_8178 [Bradyrhizobium ottawaense]
MTTQSWRTPVAALILVVTTAAAFAETPYPRPTRDGRDRIQRTGACPTGYVGSGDKCEALHADTPRAYPKIKGAACPSGTFASGDACKAFR